MSIHVIAGATAGPFTAVCALLAVAGAAKIRRPDATQPAVSALGLPASAATVRSLGLIEVGVAAAGIALGGIAAAAIALVYGALAIAASRLYLRAPGTACGCLGASDAPVSPLHIVVNVAAAMTATIAIGAGTPLAAVGAGVPSRVAFVLLVGCCTWLLVAALDALPSLNTAVREGRAS